MMKTKIILMSIAFVYLLFSIAEASTFYEIRLMGDDIRLNTTLVLKSEDPINVWEITWSLPKNSELISVRDDVGEIKDYQLSGNQLTLTTNSKRASVRYIYIDSIVEDVVDNTYLPVFSFDISLSGIPNDTTTVDVNVPEILSGYSSFGFSEEYEDDFARFEGKGPVSIRIWYSFKGKDYDNFVVFGDYDATLADELYSVVTNITGVKPPFERFPLVILPDDDFDAKINDWAAGTHLTGGLIAIRESTANSDTNVSIILHEVVHGYNSKVLSWDETGIVWFDEGTGKFVEYVVNGILDVAQPTLFGDDVVVYRGSKGYILKPKGSIDELWNYYQRDLNFMKTWNTENPDTREFGYAYSELLIRDYAKKYGIDSLKSTYRKLADVDHVVTDTTEHNAIMLESLNYNFRPCYSGDYSTFSECIQAINRYTLTVPGFSGEYTEPKKAVPTNTGVSEAIMPEKELQERPFLERLIDNLRNLVSSTIQKINDLFS